MKKDAVVYLLNNQEKDISNFRESISRLYSFFLRDFGENVDLVLFHEGDFPQEEIDRIESALSNFNVKIPHYFHKLSFDEPDYPSEIQDKIPMYSKHPQFPNALGFSIGYRKMCDFFSGGIFKLDIIKNYRYIWRLDTDSFLLSPLLKSPFSTMWEWSKVYGYINIQNDHPQMCVGLWEESESFFKQNPELLVNDIYKMRKNHEFMVFYTNFEIMDVDWFSNPNGGYMKYYERIRAAGGIFTTRWGDHVVRYLAVNSMCKDSEIKFFDDINYYHSSHYLNKKYNIVSYG